MIFLPVSPASPQGLTFKTILLPSQDELFRRVQVEDGFFVQELGRHHRDDDVFLELGLDVLELDGGRVLYRDENGVHSQRDDLVSVDFVLNGDLNLSVRAHPGADFLESALAEPL